MKKLMLSLMAMMLGLFVWAQEKEQPSWKEMDAFHEIMSGTFHPAEEGKLDPIKQRCGEMVDLAVAWQKSTPPAAFNKPEIKKGLDKLVKGSKDLNKMIKKNAADADIMKAFKELHDVYHGIVGLCKD